MNYDVRTKCVSQKNFHGRIEQGVKRYDGDKVEEFEADPVADLDEPLGLGHDIRS
jgi:hypothetical protein